MRVVSLVLLAAFLAACGEDEGGNGPEATPDAGDTSTPDGGETATPLGAPAGVVAVAGNARATVSWSAPTEGSGITSYLVTSTPGDITATTTGATTTVVSGLTNGTRYTFTVHATNALGDGPESAPSNPVIPMADAETGDPLPPGAATNVVAIARNGGADITWTPPEDDGGGAIVRYTVTATPSGRIAVSPGRPAATLTGLTNGTRYTFTVVATNAGGSGPASEPSNEVTPLASLGPVDTHWIRSPVPPDAPVFELTADTATDTTTGLIWARAPAAGVTHGRAITSCEELTVEWQTGWRIPTLLELSLLVDETRVSPSFDRTVFPTIPAQGFLWVEEKSSENDGVPYYMAVDAADGTTTGVSGGSTHHVLCVK